MTPTLTKGEKIMIKFMTERDLSQVRAWLFIRETWKSRLWRTALCRQISLNGLDWEKGTRIVRDVRVDMLTGGKKFPYKHAHRATWVSSDQITGNQIDYICKNKKFGRSVVVLIVKHTIFEDEYMISEKIKTWLLTLMEGKNWWTQRLDRYGVAQPCGRGYCI